jgi:hypothetical protein
MTKRASKAGGDRACVAHGPLEVERCLERDVRAEMERVRSDPGLLGAPIVIVVPSRSLRLHVGRKLAAWCGGATVGWRVVTLFGLARDVCTGAGASVPRGARLFEPLVAAAAARTTGLGTDLAAFEDGARAAAASVADLVDAGFAAEHAPALAKRLDAGLKSGLASPAEIARARALVDIAAQVQRESQRLGVGRASAMLRCATEALARDRSLVRARAVWIHGFSDATGAASDLLAALAERADARIFWDACAHGVFGARLRERLRVGVEEWKESGAAEAALARASSADAEARAVADRVRALLDAGAEPESIGVVARDLGPYRIALRRHFLRLAIPFSGQAASRPDGPAERRARAFAECVAQGAACAIDRWLDARGPATFAASRAKPYELRIAMRALGIATLADLAELEVDDALEGRAALALPLRGITTVEDCDADPEDGTEVGDDAADEDRTEGNDAAAAARPRAALPRREVVRADLQREVVLARASLDSLAALDGTVDAAAGLRAVRALATGVLAIGAEDHASAILLGALDALAADLPAALVLESRALRAVVEREIDVRAAQPIGGAGGGVACLNVVEARARTFGALFVMGLARGRFPRNVREDALLSDALRRAWSAELPHLPVKSTGRDEERALFDQLVRSADKVHLSWPTLDDEGKALLPSALLERVATHEAVTGATLADGSHDAVDPPVRPAHEHATAAALRAGVAGLEPLLPLAVAETRAFCALDDARAAGIADARIAVLREHERFPAQAELGPYFGMIGRLATRDDLRHGDLFVTQLEGVARCGWKALVTRVLRLEPPLDPLAALPNLDARLVGDVVHAVLQEVVAGMEDHARWPAARTVEEMLYRAARAKLSERGTFVAGFDALVAARARPMLDAARALDELESAAIRASRSEVPGGIDLPEGVLGKRRLLFRADRVDELADAPRFTDYKTGAPISRNQGEDTRLRNHLQEIARGRALQATAYAIGAGPAGSGRYVFLKADVETAKRVFAIGGADAEARELFDEAVDRILGAIDMGVLFPRLLQSDAQRTNLDCARCEMAQACLRGDSGANRRLAKFVNAPAREGAAQEAAFALWSLATQKVER